MDFLKRYKKMIALRGLTDHTMKSYCTYISAYLDYISNTLHKYPSQVRYSDIIRFLDRLQQDRGLSDRTINTAISQIRFFTLYVLHNPWDPTQVPINYTILCQKNIRIISFQTLSVFVLSAEAAKSCSKGAIAAFGPGEFHRVFGGGSKILLPRRDCCLWPRRVSSGLRQRQQNPAPEARLLPLGPAGFIGSPAEAAKSCS